MTSGPLVLGALCVLLGVTSGFAVPVLKEIVADPSYGLLTLLLGLVFLAAGSALYYFPKRPMRVEGVPDELKGSFVDRRDGLSPTQRILLSIVEEETTPARKVLQEAIETRFDLRGETTHSGAEVYYRLGQLRLLGFVERESLTPDGPHTYRVSSMYWQELRGQLRPVRVYPPPRP